MSTHTTRPWILRPAPILWITGPLVVMISGAILVGWLLLPRVAPKWTIAYSPFYGPAFNAGLQRGRHDFLDQVEKWRSTALSHAKTQLAGSDAETACLAAEVVEKLDPPDAVEILALGIPHPDARVLRDIAYHLSKREAHGQVPSLIAALSKHTDVFAFDAALAISPLLEDEHYPLTGALRSSANARERALAASVVCRLENPDAVQFIISQIGQYVAEYKPEHLLWDPAVIALARNRSETAQRCLRSEFSVSSAERRYQALWAVHTQSVRDESVDRALLPCLEDTDDRVAKLAARIVDSHASHAALEGYERLLTNELPGSSSIFLRRGWSPRQRHIPILIRHLAHPRYGSVIVNAVASHVIDDDHLLDQWMSQMARMQTADRNQVLSHLKINTIYLSEEQITRLEKIRMSAVPTGAIAPATP